VLQGIKIL